MQRTVARIIVFASILILSLSFLNGQATAAPGAQDILMTNMYVHAKLGTDCATQILIDTTVKNIGVSDLNYFDMRIDVRGLQVMSARLNGSVVNSSATSVNNYVIVTIEPVTPIPSGALMVLNLNFTTQCLQEQIGLNGDGSMYIIHLIYYIRPLNEIHNLTFSASLPPHAVLHSEAAAPLFPRATSNYTDGTRTVYVWETDILLPGQEIVHIIKYLIPAVLLDSASVTTDNSLAIGLLAAIAAAGAVLIIERIPAWLKLMRTREVIVSGKISTQEQEILDLLSKRGGSCSQREIYENLDMSQAMASMMLTSLEERGLIKRLRSGRENIVHIMED
ncbi:MAG: MarR family transcriptional regulator [Candidatus Thorarchaeota archaeon]|nr:MarR family transcriptional regulator [Candidatus Thorarchaeota archaeon]